VIHGDDVDWRPAIDVNRIIMGGQLIAAAALLLAVTVVRNRPRKLNPTTFPGCAISQVGNYVSPTTEHLGEKGRRCARFERASRRSPRRSSPSCC
jgi:hypothetical protein